MMALQKVRYTALWRDRQMLSIRLVLLVEK